MSAIDEIEREIAKVKLLNDMSDGMTAPRSTRVLELAAIEITSANERIRVLTDGEALRRRNAHDWKEAYNAEREVADKLEKALKDTLSHLVAAASLLSRSPKTAAPSNKMFDQMVVDYKAAAKRARAALAEVAAIRKKEGRVMSNEVDQKAAGGPRLDRIVGLEQERR